MNICIVNCFDTYEHRVDLLYKIFTESGYNVEVLTSDFKHIEKKKRADKKDGFRFFHAMSYRKNISINRLYSHKKLSEDIFDYVEKKAADIDLLWVLVPPNSVVKDAAKIKRENPSIKLVFDLIDLWPETMPIGKIKKFWPFSIWQKLRDDNLKLADYVVTECDIFKQKLENILHGIKTETLYLARPLGKYKPKLNLPEDKVSLCYLGSMNNIIDIDTIVNIVQDFQKIKPVEIHVIGTGEKKDELIKRLQKAAAEVVYHGVVYDREDKQKIFDRCHYGLNIMKDSVCVGLTMKSMDYLEFGLPIINNIYGDTWDAVSKYGFGINYEEKTVLVESKCDYRIAARTFFENFLTEEVFKNKVVQVLGSL